MSLVQSLMMLKRVCDEGMIRNQPGVVLLFNSFEDQMRFRQMVMTELGQMQVQVHNDGEMERMRLAGFDMATGLR